LTPINRESPDVLPVAGASLAVLLGSGLSGVSDPFATRAVLPFAEIPRLAAAGVAGHDGELRRCVVAAKPCLFIHGRKHFYEGAVDDMPRLVEFVHDLGVRRLILTSAAGSLTKSICPGELVLVDDILDVQFRPPARHRPPAHRPGESPPLTRLRSPYETSRTGRPGMVGRMDLDPDLNRRLWVAGARSRIALVRGSVATCAGPIYETPAEIGMLQQTGASLVTMSGAPEVAAANGLGIRVAMIALVTNWAAGISNVRLRHDDVLAAAGRAAPLLTRLITQFIENK
jgi:inosine/guanosine/xanthosine phosphorylase family protein